MPRPAPYQWRPLGWNTDPVPGDPQVITEEARQLAQLATLVETQITALRRIASDQADLGKTAGQIRSAATDLVGQLTLVAARYQKVSATLAGWSADLNEAQSLSIRALNAAETPYAQLTNPAPPPAPAAPQLLNPVQLQLDQQAAAASARATAARAQAELDAAVAILNRAIGFRDTQAGQVAAQINAAASDALTDSFWDQFTNWVTDNAGWLKELATVLGYIVGVLAFVALLIPGVDILVLAGLALTAAMLAVHVMLAATGNGGWLGVGLDIFGLVTMGYGIYAVRSVEAGVVAARNLAEVQRTAMLKRVLESGPYPIALRLFRGLVNEDGGLSDMGRLGVKNVYRAIEDETPTVPEEGKAVAGWAKTAQQFKTGWQTLKSPADFAEAFRSGGDPAIVAAMKNIETLQKAFSSVGDAAEAAQRTVKLANIAFRVGDGLQFTDSGLGIFVGDSYDKWKDDVSTHPLSTSEVEEILGLTDPVAYGLVSSQW